MPCEQIADWTYGGDPAGNSVDAVRFAIGDTVSADRLLSDGEIDYLLSQYTTVARASVYACKRIAAKFARLADYENGDTAAKLSQKSKRYSELADELKEEFALTDIEPYAGGISASDKQANESDSDYDRPSFTRAMDSMTIDPSQSVQ